MFANINFFFIYIAFITPRSDVVGFVVPDQSKQQTRNPHFKQSSSHKKNNIVSLSSSVDDELAKLERARAGFEALMKDQDLFVVEDDQDIFPTSKEDYIPVLTESSKRRREIEMALIQSLETSDDAIEELINLWVSERDEESAAKLKGMEAQCSQGNYAEERFLKDMIHEYGYHWVEPISRLALLYYTQGRTKDCEYWGMIAHAVKPWHFEVANTLVKNSLKNNDHKGAEKWMKMTLPTLDQPQKRKAWIQQALRDSTESIARAEKAKKKAVKNQLVLANTAKLEQTARLTKSANTPEVSFDTSFDDAWQ